MTDLEFFAHHFRAFRAQPFEQYKTAEAREHSVEEGERVLIMHQRCFAVDERPMADAEYELTVGTEQRVRIVRNSAIGNLIALNCDEYVAVVEDREFEVVALDGP